MPNTLTMLQAVDDLAESTADAAAHAQRAAHTEL
jgi:hypothetical protein